MAINQINPPSNLNLNHFMSRLNELGNVAQSCRFAVQFSPVSRNLPANDLIYVCDSVEFPGRGFDVTEVRYYGPSQVFPNNSMYQQANFSFICRQRSVERKFFDDWMDIINPPTSFNFEYAANYYSTVKIYQLANYSSKNSQTQGAVTSGDVIYGWTLRKAYPILVVPQQVTWADNDILRLQVTFTYKYWDREDFK
jgi:hypothetical protein